MNSTNDSERVSTFRLVAGTPMRDLIRGRVTGRLDIEYLTESAGLPGPIREVVKQTVQRTRLLRIEKSDVARELIAHFRDGLDSGADASALASSFGDTRVAARLIRRAKKRDRSIVHKALTRSVKAFGALVLLLILTYGVLAIRYFGAKPGPTVDYLARFNAAALAIPEDERAWPIYREALIEHRPRQKQTENTISLGVYPGWRDWEQSVAHIREHAAFLDEVRRGASMRGMGYIASTRFTTEDEVLWPENAGMDESSGLLSESLIGVLLPHLGEVHGMAQMLALDARLAATEGDAERATTNLRAIIRIAEQTREIPLLINDIFAISIVARAIEDTVHLIHEHPDLLSDANLATLAHALAGFPSDGQPLARFDGERMVFEDAVQRLYSLDSDGNGVLLSGAFDELMALEGRAPDTTGVANTLVGPVAAALMADRKTALGFYNDALEGLLAWSKQPTWNRGAYASPVESLDNPLSRARHLLVTLIMPAFENSVRQAEQTEFVRDSALVVIAIELHRRREGRLPSKLDELVPELLPRVPLDLFTGEPIRYRVEGDSFVLWSVGNDYIDDGGAVVEGTKWPYPSHIAGRWFARDVVEERIGRVNAGDPEMIKNTGKGQRAPGIINGDWILYPPAPVVEPPPKDVFPEVLIPR
jgi:hypothetical protein